MWIEAQKRLINLDKCIAFQLVGEKLFFEYDFVFESDICHTVLEFDDYEKAKSAYQDILAGIKAGEKIVWL